MTLPDPTRPAPPMPPIKPPAIDWRALLVRYMARVIDAESVSFVDTCGGWEIILTPEETEELLRIEIEAAKVPSDRLKEPPCA